MNKSQTYLDLKGHEISLVELDPEERQLVSSLRAEAAKQSDWNAFSNYWLNAVAKFYDARGVSRKASRQKAAYQIGQDLGNRIAIATGMAQPPNYRSQLQDIIATQFQTNRAFCEATGLSEDMLSHVLAGRKDLSMQALSQALDRIGYDVRIQARQKTAV